jgi:hypothetical protein
VPFCFCVNAMKSASYVAVLVVCAMLRASSARSLVGVTVNLS